MAAKKVIETKNLSKVFKNGEIEVHALTNINILIEEGEFVAIMGASGSGKSTLLNILGCLDKPTEGEYYLDGVFVNDLNKNQLAAIRNQKIGFIFQSYNLLSRTTALENVELPLVYNRTGKFLNPEDHAKGRWKKWVWETEFTIKQTSFPAVNSNVLPLHGLW